MSLSAHGEAVNPIQARYILPSFIEHSSFGMKESNPYNKLFEERIIFLGVQVDDASARRRRLRQCCWRRARPVSGLPCPMPAS